MYGNAFAQDRMGIFNEYETLLFSPLRRCQSTAAQVFGLAHDHQAAGQPDLKVQNFPWAHEELKSESDLGKDTADLMDFTVKVRDAHIALLLGSPDRSWSPAAPRSGVTVNALGIL